MAGTIVGFGATLLLLAAVAAALRWTPLARVTEIGVRLTTLRDITHAPGATAAILAIYASTGIVAFPITVLVIATAIIF